MLTAPQAMLPNVPANMQGLNPMKQEVWTDVQSRAQMAKALILDTNKGMLDMMVGNVLFLLRTLG